MKRILLTLICVLFVFSLLGCATSMVGIVERKDLPPALCVDFSSSMVILVQHDVDDDGKCDYVAVYTHSIDSATGEKIVVRIYKGPCPEPKPDSIM